VWQEATELRNRAYSEFLNKTVVERMIALGDIIAEHATPWTKYYPSAAEDFSPLWYEKY
jgi:hypothetical protein